MSARALLARLNRPLDLLGAGADTPPARQRSLRDTLAWSCSLLSPGAHELLRGLSVFSGGCTLEAAVAVAGGGDTAAMLDRLDELLAHSLLAREDTADGEPRYTLLETIREYAQEEAQQAGEFEALAQRHLQHHLMLAESLLPAWCGATRNQALGVLAGETANLRAALQSVVRTRPDPASAMRLAAALTWWWYFTGQLLEGRQ